MHYRRLRLPGDEKTLMGTDANKSLLVQWPRNDNPCICHLCGEKIERLPMFRVQNAHAKYYHVECARKVNHL